MTRWSVALLGQADRRWCRPGASRPAVALHERRARGAPPKMEGDPGRAGACATRAGAGQARSSPLVGSSTGPLNGPGPVCCTSRAALCALGGCARARPEGESRPGCAKMRAPRRRTLRKGGRRAEAPFQGASAALSMATLAGAACVGRHELPCRHTARESKLIGTVGSAVCWINHKTTPFDNLYRGMEKESRKSHPKGREIVEQK